jgi:hypothetical protein
MRLTSKRKPQLWILLIIKINNPVLDIVENQEEAQTLEEDPFFGWEEPRRRLARIHKRMEKVGLRSVEETLTEAGRKLLLLTKYRRTIKKRSRQKTLITGR